MSGIIINEDCNHFIMTRFRGGIQVTEQVLREFIHQYANTQVTDLVFNPNGAMSFAPSSVKEMVLAKFKRYKEEGKVDDTNSYCQVLCDLEEQGLDMYSIWIDQCRKDSITPWISIRMNDCHCNDQEDHILLTEMRKEKPYLKRVMHRDYDNYFDNCLDYGQQEVRGHYLAYIQECLEKYDMDGLELDWQRELFCFQCGQEHEGISIINDFMRRAKQMVDQAADRRGHPIKVCARVAHSPIVSLKMGFDVMAWSKEKLVDVVVPAPRWETSDTDMSIDFWKRILDGTDVELAAGMDINFRSHPEAPMKSQTMETAAGNAVVNLSNGAEKIYLFNYMDNLPDMTNEDFSGLLGEGIEMDMFLDVSPSSAKAYQATLNNIGSLETLLKMSRRHVVTYHDIHAFGVAAASILPIKITGKGHFTPVRIENGIVPSDKKITLIIAAEVLGSEKKLTKDDFMVFVNSQEIEYLGEIEVPFAYSEATHYAFSVKNCGNYPYSSVAEFASSGKEFRIEHVELRVD